MARPFAWTDFEIQDCVGVGHSGAVYRARLKQATQGLPEDAVVAIKRYKAWLLDEPGFIERLFREVDTGRAIVHPNVLRVFGAVMDSDARPALVMQFHEGLTLVEDLKLRLSSNTPYPFEEAIATLRSIAAGLVALHERGIIHRDVKPANVLVGNHDAIIAALVSLEVLRFRNRQ